MSLVAHAAVRTTSSRRVKDNPPYQEDRGRVHEQRADWHHPDDRAESPIFLNSRAPFPQVFGRASRPRRAARGDGSSGLSATALAAAEGFAAPEDSPYRPGLPFGISVAEVVDLSVWL